MTQFVTNLAGNPTMIGTANPRDHWWRDNGARASGGMSWPGETRPVLEFDRTSGNPSSISEYYTPVTATGGQYAYGAPGQWATVTARARNEYNPSSGSQQIQLKAGATVLASATLTEDWQDILLTAQLDAITAADPLLWLLHWTAGANEYVGVVTGSIGLWVTDTDPRTWSGGGAAEAPTISTTALDAMTAGRPFVDLIEASGTYPVTFAVTAGALPAGLTLSAAGLLTGTPTEPGAYSFTVTATNTEGTDTETYAGTVAGVPPLPDGRRLYRDRVTLYVGADPAVVVPAQVVPLGVDAAGAAEDVFSRYRILLAPRVDIGLAAPATVKIGWGPYVLTGSGDARLSAAGIERHYRRGRLHHYEMITAARG